MQQIIQPRVLVLAPLTEEWRLLAEAFGCRYPIKPVNGLRIPCCYLRAWLALLAPGGHGKTQCAVHAQYLADCFASAEMLVCAGAAGSDHPDYSCSLVVERSAEKRATPAPNVLSAGS